jgi:hypothetical protein
MAFKLATFSLDPLVVDKLNRLSYWMHMSNKSGLVAQLIEKEYRRQQEVRGDEDEQ